MKKLFFYLFISVLIMSSPFKSAAVEAVNSPVLKGKIKGTFVVKDPLPGSSSFLLVYDSLLGPPPNPYSYWRIPDMILPVMPDGEWSIELPDGVYYVALSNKPSGTLVGPPLSKELYYLHADAKGSPVSVKVKAPEEILLGKCLAYYWDPSKIQRQSGITTVEGKVTDQQGKPVADVYVFASLTEYPVGKPLFISDKTDSSGRFQLRVHDAGTYFLKSRGVIGGGNPETGEYLSVTNDFAPVRIDISKGEIKKGISIKVKRFERSPLNSGKGMSQKSPPSRQ